jgi:hypothetical protein
MAGGSGGLSSSCSSDSGAAVASIKRVTDMAEVGGDRNTEAQSWNANKRRRWKKLFQADGSLLIFSYSLFHWMSVEVMKYNSCIPFVCCIVPIICHSYPYLFSWVHNDRMWALISFVQLISIFHYFACKNHYMYDLDNCRLLIRVYWFCVLHHHL